MTLEQRVNQLEKQVDNLNKAFLQAQRNQVPITAKVDDSANQVKAITPYTETQIGYYGETEKTFYGVPSGNLNVFFSNYKGKYEYMKIADRLVIYFDALKEQTDITISIL